jgi:hypothetical protein
VVVAPPLAPLLDPHQIAGAHLPAPESAVDYAPLVDLQAVGAPPPQDQSGGQGDQSTNDECDPGLRVVGHHQ